MRSLSFRLLLSLLTLVCVPAAMAHDVTLTGTTSFASLDGSASDHDGSANGVFTVNDGNLVVNGVVNCNDDSTTDACSMAFNVSGDLTVNAGGALYAENRTGSGMGGAITLTVGGNLALSGNAIVSTASKTSSGGMGGAITTNVGGSVALASGTTVDSGSSNAGGGAIVIAAGGVVSVDGDVLSGPSRTFLSTRLSGGAALDGGTANTVGGTITLSSATFAEPAMVIGSNASIVSQGAGGGAGPVTIDGCGIQVHGLIAALSKNNSAAKVSIRSGKDVLIDGRDLGGSGTRMGRIRADAPSGTALNKGVDIFAAETIDIFGPASGLFVVTSLPGLHDSKSYGGVIRIMSVGDAVNASGNVIDDGHSASGDSGGTVEISAKEDVTLDTAVIRAHGDFNTNNNNRGGGAIRIRSYSGDVIWTNGTGDVRPVGSSSGLPLVDQGSIVLTACGTVNTTGSSFPTNGVPTSVFPETHTGVCSPAAPTLPSGVPPLITCNTPPVANDVSATTNEDTTVTITLSGTDADGDSLTFSIVSDPFFGTLGAIVPTGPTTATVDYSPNLNYNGADSFVYQANDGNGGTDNATVSITINAVNDPPSFLAGHTVTVLEDSGAQTYSGWATAISAGPADESGQTVTFTVTNDNNTLFSTQPAVDGAGNLTFTPAANAYGSANITVVAQDNGGTANGGNDTSAAQFSAISVTPVNDEPSFTLGADVSVNEDSGAYSAGWATAISAGPNESGQTVTFNVSNDNALLFSMQPSISSTGVLTFTPAANASGSATVSVSLMDNGGTANGGDDTSPTVAFTITVNSVNDEPSFTPGDNVTVPEDSGSYSAVWATDISAGPGETQNLTFNVSNNNNALFSAQPSIAADGTLTFTVAGDAFGTATVAVSLMDDGGTANGGDDTSSTVTFSITVDPVNDAPSFTPGVNVTVNEDSGAFSAAWATAISAGPANESGQTVSFNVSNDNNALFSAQPSISSTGVLTFTPALNAFGTATVTVSLSDNGGTGNGGVDTSGSVTFTITINAVNDPPTAGNDTWETEGNTELRVDHGTSATPHVFDTTPFGTGVLHNDADSVEGDPIVVTGVVACADTTAPFVCAITGGTLTLEANGTFFFHPSPGATSASFQYTITDQPSVGAPASATGSVTLTIHDMIWYVNGSAAPGGNGTSDEPFQNLGSLTGVGDVDGAGDYIFIHNSTVNGSIELEASQKLWGEGVGLIIPRNLNGNGFPTTLVAPGPRPNLIAAGDAVLVTGVTGVEIAGLNITTASGNGIDVTSLAGGSAASATIYSNGIIASGAEGIDINADSAAGTSVSINGTDVTAMGNGVNLLATDGNVVFAFSNGTVASVTGTGIVVDGAAADSLTISGLANVTISGATAGDGVSINVARFDANPGTAAFDVVNAGAMAVGTALDPVGGAALKLTTVSGNLAFGTLGAHGSTTGVTIAGTGLFTGLAGMQVTSGGGAVSAAAGVGLSVTNTTIGAANLSFTSINATGAANGIVLNNTGTSGGLVVTGTGAAGTGGTITGTISDAILLTNTGGVSLSFMNVQNSQESGVLGTNVSGLSLASTAFTNNGNDSADEGIRVTNLWGTSAWSNVTVSGSAHNNVFIQNTSGSLTSLTITGGSFANNGGVFGANSILFEATGTASVGMLSISGVTVDGAPSSGVLIQAQGTATISDALVSASNITNNGIGLNFTQANSASIAFKVLNNVNLNGSQLHAINVFSSSASTGGTLAGRIQGNLIGQSGVPGSGGAFGNGIRTVIQGQTRGIVLIDSNVVRQTPFGRGIEVTGMSAPGLDVTLTNNDVNPQDASGFPAAAIFVTSDDIGTGGLVRADIRGNTVPAASDTFDYPTFDGTAPYLVFEELSGATSQLVDTPPASADASAQLASTNTGSTYANAGVALIAGPIMTPP